MGKYQIKKAFSTSNNMNCKAHRCTPQARGTVISAKKLLGGKGGGTKDQPTGLSSSHRERRIRFYTGEQIGGHVDHVVTRQEKCSIPRHMKTTRG